MSPSQSPAFSRAGKGSSGMSVCSLGAASSRRFFRAGGGRPPDIDCGAYLLDRPTALRMACMRCEATTSHGEGPYLDEPAERLDDRPAEVTRLLERVQELGWLLVRRA